MANGSVAMSDVRKCYACKFSYMEPSGPARLVCGHVNAGRVGIYADNAASADKQDDSAVGHCGPERVKFKQHPARNEDGSLKPWKEKMNMKDSEMYDLGRADERLVGAKTTLNQLRDEATQIAVDHGFTDATVPEDLMLMVSELAEALEDHRAGRAASDTWYAEKFTADVGPHAYSITVKHNQPGPGRKPSGIPSEVADVVIRIFHFCGKHGIDLDKIVREKMDYNKSRAFKHGKVL